MLSTIPGCSQPVRGNILLTSWRVRRQRQIQQKRFRCCPLRTRGILTSITELGNVWDPAQLSYSVTNPGGPLPDIPSSATSNSRGAGGHTLAIGRPEFSKFDQNGMRAWQLLDVFSGKTANTNFINTAGLVNINTASRDVLRSLAAGILQNSDPAIQPPSLLNNLYPPRRPPPASSQADKFADAVINSRPLLSTAALSAIRDSQGQPFLVTPTNITVALRRPRPNGMILAAKSCLQKSIIWPRRAAVTSASLLPGSRWIKTEMSYPP